MSGGSQLGGINEFCRFYDIEMTTVKTDTLKKNWDRSKVKKNWMIDTGKYKDTKRNYTFKSKCISEDVKQ